MDKPNSAKLDAITHRVAEIHKQEALLLEHKKKLKIETRALAEIENITLKVNVARYAYWMIPETAVEDIALAITGKRNKKFIDMMGEVRVGLQCDVCKSVLPIKSRTQMKAELDRDREQRSTYAEGYTHVCKSCHEKALERRDAQYRRDDKKRNLEISRLQALPYTDYVKTPKWIKNKYEMMGLRRRMGGMDAVLKCELCPKTKNLDVRHKSKNAIGREHFDNTIIVCQDCTTLLAKTDRVIS